MSDRTLYMHIGMPKTGTTYIQKFCVANRRKLLEHGILFPTPTATHTGHAFWGREIYFAVYNDPAEHLNIRKKLLSEIRHFRSKNIIFSDETAISQRCSDYKELLDLPMAKKFIVFFRTAASYFESQCHFHSVTRHFTLNLNPGLLSFQLSDWLNNTDPDDYLARDYDKTVRDGILIDEFLKCVGIEDSSDFDKNVITSENITPKTEYSLFLYHLKQIPIENNDWEKCVAAIRYLSQNDPHAVSASLAPREFFSNPSKELLAAIRQQARLLNDPDWEEKSLNYSTREPYPYKQLPAARQHEIFEALPEKIKNIIIDAYPPAKNAAFSENLLPDFDFTDKKRIALNDIWRRKLFASYQTTYEAYRKFNASYNDLINILFVNVIKADFPCVYDLLDKKRALLGKGIENVSYDQENKTLSFESLYNGACIFFNDIVFKKDCMYLMDIYAEGSAGEWTFYYFTEHDNQYSNAKTVSFDPTMVSKNHKGALFLFPPDAIANLLRLHPGIMACSCVIKKFKIYEIPNNSVKFQ